MNTLHESEIAAAAKAPLHARSSHLQLDVAKHPAMPSGPNDAYAIQALITTGSLMGLELAPAGATVSASIAEVGTVEVKFDD